MRAYSTLTEVAPDVTDLQVGQRVMALVPWGAYADSLVVDTVCVLPVPDDMTDLTAAGFPVAYATAHVSLVHRGSLRAGQAAVIIGATGNVGEDIAGYAAAGALSALVPRRSAAPPDPHGSPVPRPRSQRRAHRHRGRYSRW
ncbi:MAG: hypothetical protein ACT4NY_12250 [Pseudonocardiales bacterium]